jgi:hypothetical protein
MAYIAKIDVYRSPEPEQDEELAKSIDSFWMAMRSGLMAQPASTCGWRTSC